MPATDKQPANFEVLNKLPLREICSALIFLSAILFALSIFSYSSKDPAFTYSSADAIVSNWMGVSGSYAADISLFLVGWTAYLVPIGLMWFGEWSAPGSIFIGITVAIILGTFLNLVLFRPLPKLENGKLLDDQ